MRIEIMELNVNVHFLMCIVKWLNFKIKTAIKKNPLKDARTETVKRAGMNDGNTLVPYVHMLKHKAVHNIST